MTNNKIVKSIVLITSITLVGLFIAYRSGFFDNNEKRFPSPKSFSNTNSDSFISNSIALVNNIDSIKKDSPIIVSYEPLDFKLGEINFVELLKNAKRSKDTVEVELPDSLFLINDETIFIKDKLVNREDFENFLYNNLTTQYFNQRKVSLSSSKSMAIFSSEEKLINFKNLKFKYNKTIPENYLLEANLFKSNLNKIWPTKKLYGFSLTEKETNQNLFMDSLKIDMDEMMLSSKSGYIISKNDLKKATTDNIMSSSKSRIIFSKEDVKKDSIAKINIDSLNKARASNMLRGSKSAIIFDSKDFKRKQKTSIKKLKDSISKANK